MKTKHYHQKHHIIQCRKYQWRGKAYAAITVLQLFDFNDANKHYTKQTYLSLNMACLNLTNGELFDIGMPKPSGEFLAAGYCYPAEKMAKKSFVRITLGEQQKTLAVYGNRYWQGAGVASTMTEPEDFSKMPISNQQAYGGEGYPLNPQGKGFAYIEPPKEDAGQPVLPKMAVEFPEFVNEQQKPIDESIPKMFSYPLPNTENPEQLILNKTDMPKPATFYPIPYSNRERTKLFGTFDEKWTKTNWPHFANDMQWQYFMCSEQRQQYPHYFRGDEYFSIENMHPEKPVIKGQLPLWNVRCFVEKLANDEQLTYNEVTMRLDTVWFLPEHEKGVLVWHGYTEVTDLNASNVASIHIEDEGLLSEHKDKAYYYQLLKQRQHKPTLKERQEEYAAKLEPHLAALKKKAWDDFVGKYQEAIKETEHLQKQVSKTLNDITDPAAGDKNKEALAKLALLSAGLKYKDADTLSKEFQDFKTKNNLDFFKKGDSFKTSIEKINKLIDEKIKKSLQPFEQELKKQNVKIEDVMAHARHSKSYYKAQRLGKKLSDIAATTKNEKLKAAILGAAETFNTKIVDQHGALLKKHEGQIFYYREQVEIALQTEQSFENCKMQLLDLKNLDFSGLNLKGACFVHCDLQHCDFSKADLTLGLFTGSDLSHVSFKHALMLKANLSETTLCHSDFSYADLEYANLIHSKAENCSFSNTNFRNTKLFEVTWQDINLQGATGNKTLIQKSTLKNINLRDSVFNNAKFIEGDWQNIDLSGSDFSHSIFSGLTFEKLPAEKSNLELSTFNECSISNGDFNLTQGKKMKFVNCKLNDCLFTKADLTGAQFTGCVANNVKCLDSDLTNTRLTRQTSITAFYAENCTMHRAAWLTAEVGGAIFKRCSLDFACFDNANLNQSQFLYCEMTHSRFYQADLSQAKLYWCNLTSALLRQTKITQSSFKHCNLYGVDFFHAVTKQTIMDKNLMTDPLPANFESIFIHG